MAPAKSRSIINGVKPKRVRTIIPPEQRARILEKQISLSKDLAAARQEFLDQALIISDKHNRSIDWVHRQLFLGGRLLRKRRGTNVWNGFVRQELCEANADLGPGQRYKLPEFISENLEDLQERYRKLSTSERRALQQELEEVRMAKSKITRTNPKAMLRDIDATFEAMSQEWHAANQRTGVEGFYIVVKGDVEHYHDPKMYFSSKAARFFQDVFNLDPKRLALKFEAYVISGLDEGPSKLTGLTRGKAVSQCRKIIQEGLVSILQSHNMPGKSQMNYDNYEGKVVERWGVALIGWPNNKGVVRNPAKVGGTADVKVLLKALTQGDCKWVKLTDEELEQRIETNQARQAAGEEVYKGRKAAARKGGVKSADTIDDEDEDAEGEDEEVEDDDMSGSG